LALPEGNDAERPLAAAGDDDEEKKLDVEVEEEDDAANAEKEEENGAEPAELAATPWPTKGRVVASVFGRPFSPKEEAAGGGGAATSACFDVVLGLKAVVAKPVNGALAVHVLLSAESIQRPTKTTRQQTNSLTCFAPCGA